MTAFRIIIRPPPSREANGRPHFFQDLQVIVQAAFRNADLVGAIGRRAGALVIDEMVQADKPVK